MRLSARIWALGLLAFAASSVSTVAEAQASGDAARGARVAYTCLGCHGIPNYNNTYPTYRVPKLRGQHPEYLVIALQAYRSGERSHGTMNANAVPLTEQDLGDVAVYLAGPVVAPAASAAPVGTPPAAAAVCVACHGNDGVGITPQYPTLSGQYPDYLARALTDYKKGGRKNAVMSGFAGQLSDKDIKELAAYYAAQRPSLDTVPKRNNRFFAR
jgi:cytochrome c553